MGPWLGGYFHDHAPPAATDDASSHFVSMVELSDVVPMIMPAAAAAAAVTEENN